ncbi:MAG: hypothetical protein OXG56_10615 [Gammaproteobacteria bacterium]|nr:hypothetical protein [Gammaproteobacteria bacterium]
MIPEKMIPEKMIPERFRHLKISPERVRGPERARLSRTRAWAGDAGLDDILNRSYEECIAQLQMTGKLEEFYTAFPEYRP